MTETPVAKLIITLGIPTTVSVLITSLYNLADTYFVGTLGESAQGAVGILFTLQGFIQASAYMLGHGSGTFVAKELAEKNEKRASVYVSSAFFAGLILGAVITVFGLIFLTPFMRLLGSTETILPYAREYGVWVVLSAPFIICSIILNNNLRYEGKAFFAMIGLTSGAVINVALDYVFVMVVGLGVFGAGMATAVSQVISFTFLLVLYNKMAQSHISFRYVAKKISLYLTVLKVGFPSFIRQGLTAVSGGVMNNLTKPFGDGAIAAMSIVNRYTSLITCVGLGIGQGYQPVAAFNYQLKKYNRVKKGLLATMGIGFGCVLFLSVFGLIFPKEIVSLFQKLPEVVKTGARALVFASAGLPLMPLIIPVNMLYQSIRSAKTAAFLSLLRSGAVLIPTALILSSIFGLNGIFVSQPASDFITAIINIPFVISFVRRHKEAPSVNPPATGITPSAAQAVPSASVEPAAPTAPAAPAESAEPPYKDTATPKGQDK